MKHTRFSIKPVVLGLLLLLIGLFLRELTFFVLPFGFLFVLVGLIINNLTIAWVGLLLLVVFGVKTILSIGGYILPLTGILLIVLTVLQFRKSGLRFISFFFPVTIILTGVVLFVIYY